MILVGDEGGDLVAAGFDVDEVELRPVVGRGGVGPADPVGVVEAVFVDVGDEQVAGVGFAQFGLGGDTVDGGQVVVVPVGGTGGGQRGRRRRCRDGEPSGCSRPQAM